MATNIEASLTHSLFNERQSFKFLFAGDPGCGKTRTIQTYIRSTDPKVITHSTTSTSYGYDLKNSNATISLVDVRGTNDITEASECFQNTDVAIFFYAINNPKSLENLRCLWIPRFRMCCGFKVPTILVGNKRDLRPSVGLRSFASIHSTSVPFFDGMKTKNCCSINMFLECSAENKDSIECLFQTAYSYII